MEFQGELSKMQKDTETQKAVMSSNFSLLWVLPIKKLKLNNSQGTLMKHSLIHSVPTQSYGNYNYFMLWGIGC